MSADLTSGHLLVLTQMQPDSPFVIALLGSCGVRCVARIAVFPEHSEEDIERLLRISYDEIGGFRGVILFLSPLGFGGESPEALDLSVWQAGLSEQIRLPFVMCKAVLNEFFLNDDPINLVLVFTAPDDVIHYATSHGLTALIRSISKEYGSRGIHCNGVSYPSPFLYQPSGLDQVVKTVLFLMSDGASFINGEVIRLNNDLLPRIKQRGCNGV